MNSNRPVAFVFGTSPVCCLSNVETETFLEVWKKAHPQTSKSFEEDVFWSALYPHARPFAFVVWRLWRGYFSRDLELIRRLASVTSGNEVHFEIENFRYQNPEFGPLRRNLRLRVSGKRLIQLSKKALRQAGSPDYSLT